MSRILWIACLLVPGVALAACTGLGGSGQPKAEVREVGAFAAIRASGAYTLEVSVGKARRVEVRGDDNIVPLVSTQVSDGDLLIEMSKQTRPVLPLIVAISSPELTDLHLSGAVDLSAEGLRGERFSLELTGAGKAQLKGRVKVFEVKASGAADLLADALVAESVGLSISGAGRADVHATRSLKAEVSGAGRVRYKGNPAQVKPHVSGMGSVEPMN